MLTNLASQEKALDMDRSYHALAAEAEIMVGLNYLTSLLTRSPTFLCDKFLMETLEGNLGKTEVLLETLAVLLVLAARKLTQHLAWMKAKAWIEPCFPFSMAAVAHSRVSQFL